MKKHPNRSEEIIFELCEQLDTQDKSEEGSTESKAADAEVENNRIQE